MYKNKKLFFAFFAFFALIKESKEELKKIGKLTKNRASHLLANHIFKRMKILCLLKQEFLKISEKVQFY